MKHHIQYGRSTSFQPSERDPDPIVFTPVLCGDNSVRISDTISLHGVGDWPPAEAICEKCLLRYRGNWAIYARPDSEYAREARRVIPIDPVWGLTPSGPVTVARDAPFDVAQRYALHESGDFYIEWEGPFR